MTIPIELSAKLIRPTWWFAAWTLVSSPEPIRVNKVPWFDDLVNTDFCW